MENRVKRIIALIAMLALAVACLAYLVLIVLGKVPNDSRLKVEDIALVLIICFFLTLLTYPEAFSRLNLIKLPGGIEVTLERLQQKQQEQESDFDAFFRILADRLKVEEKYHLRALARGGEVYEGRPELRQELLRLKRFGLIDEVSTQKIGDFLDGKKENFAKFVKLTPTGEKFVQALDRIERQ